jgi:hypothetical protein
VDRYDMDLAEIVKDLENRKLPLVLCRTKSGGAHVYLFLREPTQAEDVRAAMRKLAATLGWGDCEIFPKQNMILAEQGDLGNWLNMPYLGGNETERYGVKADNSVHSLRSFLDLAESRRVDIDQLRFIKAKKTEAPPAEGMEDGPPCLEILAEQGFPDGTRNSGLFALGILCKKKYGSKWKEKLEEYNHSYMKPPLTADEVMAIMNRLDKKDYRYSCKDQPLCSYCNASLCRMRKFGVGSSGHYPQVSGLTKLDTQPPIWFMDIEDSRISLSTDQVMNYRDFQIVCMDQLSVLFMPIKGEDWSRIISDAMEDLIVLETAPEMSTLGHFLELLEDFCMNRNRGEQKEDLFLGKPWQDTDTGRHYFKLSALMAYLERNNFKTWGRNTVGKVITEDLGGRHFFNIGGKGINVVWVKENFTETPAVPLPPSIRDPI